MRIADPIRVTGGLVSGVDDAAGAVRIYKGLPFAAPPVGDLRWREPQPVRPWSGIRIADRFASVCQQPLVPRNAIMGLFSFDDPPECGMSEDCLYLNVWTGARSADEKLPVILWIFGGGHRLGGGSHPVLWGTSLAARGAVVETLNYRVGALGFLAHPELTRESGASGNYGSLDIIAALRWVRDNVAAFGGDPGCVTIYGQSAGATEVSVMMASPLARGLFHRAMGGSRGASTARCSADRWRTLQLPRAKARRWPKNSALGASKPCAICRRTRFSACTSSGVRSSTATCSSAASKRRSAAALRRRCRLSPVSTATKARRTPSPSCKHAPVSANSPTQRSATMPPPSWTFTALPTMAVRLRKAIGCAATGPSHIKPGAGRHCTRRRKTRRSFLLFCASGPLPPARRFREAVPPDGYGAWHGAELWYAFDTLNTKPFPWQSVDRQLADAFSNALLAFARDGVPDPEWPRFSNASRKAAIIANRVEAGYVPNRNALEFYMSRTPWI